RRTTPGRLRGVSLNVLSMKGERTCACCGHRQRECQAQPLVSPEDLEGVGGTGPCKAAQLGPLVGCREDTRSDCPCGRSIAGARLGVRPMREGSRYRIYHTYGTRRKRTLRVYSGYPGKSLRRIFSSSRSRQTSTGVKSTMRPSDHHEPSASGMPTKSQMALAYIG